MLFLLILLVLHACYSSENSYVLEKEESGYAFYYPLTMESKQPAKVCLEINEKLLPGKVKISFGNRTCSKTCEPHVVTTGFSCWNVTAPENNPVDFYHSSVKIQVEIETKDKIVKFKSQEELQLVKEVARVFIETDRKVYKNGDTVKIRFLALGYDLKPLKGYKIASLQIRNPYPLQTIVKRWENISLDLGLAQMEFQLAPDTTEGYWSITGDVTANFEVRKYTLPRFQASVEGPSQLYEGEKSVTYYVCGKYSNGRNVKGTALILLKISYSEETLNKSHVKELSDGCAKFIFDGEELSLRDRGLWLFEIMGTVTEEGTDQVEYCNKRVHINRSPHFTYHWLDGAKRIKPELPHISRLSLDKVQVALNSSRIEFCYKIARRKYIACGNFTMDSRNSIEVTIPPLKNVNDLKNIEIEAKLEGFSEYSFTNYLTIWHSGSKNAIKISEKEAASKKCGSALSISVLYNSGRFKTDENVEFKYILSSRHEILSTGSVLRKPKHEHLNLDDYPNVIGKEKYRLDDDRVDSFELKIQLDSKVYTNSKLLVYYDYDNEVISDYINVGVRQCTPNKIIAKWAESPLYPGEVGQLNIQADPDSLCHISSVDKASKFLGSNDVFTIDNILNGVARYGHIYRFNCIKPKVNASDTNRPRVGIEPGVEKTEPFKFKHLTTRL